MTIRLATPSPDGNRHQLLIRHILENAIATSADQQIVYRDRHRQTYRQLLDRVHRLANTLASLGTESGDTVAMMDWDSHRYLEAYFAVPMMGAVLQTVNIRLTVEQIIYCLQSSNASTLIFHRDFAPLVEAIAPHLPHLRRRILIADGETSLNCPSAGEYEVLLASSSASYDFPMFDEHALATTFHTTGTTGNPKAVSFSHRQLVLHTIALAATLAAQPDGQSLRRSDVYMPLTPMFHVHAWGVPYVATMMGVKQVYPGRYEPTMLLKLRRQERVNFSHCVPTVLQMILATAGTEGDTDLGPWTMLIGGSALSRPLRKAAENRGINTLAGYGMSETGPAIAIARYTGDGEEERETALCQAGWPLPLVQARIVDDDMRELPHDARTQGELVLRAPWLTESYAGDPEASVTLWRGGWLHTQDLATIDPNGSITIRDRIKDVIKSGGEWVSSTQIEELVALHPEIAEAAVIGVEDQRWGERPYVFIVPKPQSTITLTAESVRRHLQSFVDTGKLNRIALPSDICLTMTLPKTSIGKIDKKQLRAQMEAEASQVTK